MCITTGLQKLKNLTSTVLVWLFRVSTSWLHMQLPLAGGQGNRLLTEHKWGWNPLPLVCLCQNLKEKGNRGEEGVMAGADDAQRNSLLHRVKAAQL